MRGFEELDHTADVALRVWASGLNELFAEAAKGMFLLLDNDFEETTTEEVVFFLAVEAEPEETLVKLLNELLYQSEIMGLNFCNFKTELSSDELLVKAEGYPVLIRRKELKAVTFSELSIAKTAKGVETILVFDV